MLCIRITICIMQVIDTGDGIVQNIAEFFFLHERWGGEFYPRIIICLISSIVSTTNYWNHLLATGLIFNVGSLVIEGKSIKSSTFEKESVRIEVTFESFFLRIGKWQSPTIPLDWVNPKGYDI